MGVFFHAAAEIHKDNKVQSEFSELGDQICKMDPSSMSPSQKDELMRTVQAQVALANMQEMLSKVTDKCFRKCVTTPGTSLGSSDQCIAMCMDRYMDSFNLVSRV